MSDDIKRKDQINTRILQTAHKLIIESGGISNVKMYQIARQTGIGQATLYRRYKSMEEIFLDLLMEDIKLLKAEIALSIKNSNNSTFDQIKFFFECFIEFNEKGYQYFNGSAMIKPSLNFNYYSTPIYSWLYQTLHKLLENHLNKQSPIYLEIKFITHTLLSVISIEAYTFLRDNKYTIEQIKNNLYTIYLEPICNPVQN
ncbi:MAG: transcriptional regulator, TetR family [Firmicutes bacterium]|nr:transcriptional regulator, TetR family [Bacillota bacterium]